MDDYIYSQPVHKDFHIVMSFIIGFLRINHGQEHLETFFKEASKCIYRPLIERIKRNGLVEIEKHLKKIFHNENGEFCLDRKGNKIIFEVKKCPAIWYLRTSGIEVDRSFCKASTEIVNKAITEECGYHFSVEYEQDSEKCIQQFWKEGK